ncbi:MAG: hypothetical protein OXH68_10855 [Gammaproteobacteria bacterium]|nr:hypothetical protein [Gammaproteobacteria bacterium]
MAIGGSNPSRAAQPTVGVVCALVIVMSAASLSWTDEASPTKPDPPVGSSLDNGGVNPYSKLSNEQLVTRVGTYGDLDHDQRRWFLTELRKRMSAKGDAPQIQVDKDDRFGRIVRKVRDADQGSRETAVGTSPAGEESADATKVYGTGLPSQGEETADVATPARQSEDHSEPSR